MTWDPSINMKPLSIIKKHYYRDVKPVKMRLTKANKCVTYPYSATEYVLVKFNNFVFLVDFVILDMEEERDWHMDRC